MGLRKKEAFPSERGCEKGLGKIGESQYKGLSRGIQRLLQKKEKFCKILYNSTYKSPAKAVLVFAGLILRQNIYLFSAILSFSCSSPFLANETEHQGCYLKYSSI